MTETWPIKALPLWPQGLVQRRAVTLDSLVCCKHCDQAKWRLKEEKEQSKETVSNDAVGALKSSCSWG